MSVTKASRDINQLHPAAQKACRLLLEECEKAAVPIFITETYRSQARQEYLYAQGRTRPGQIVTWTLNSNHKSKLAWDVAVSPPKSLYDVATLNKAGAIARKLGINWGGDWKGTIDRPHFEVKANWKAPKGYEGLDSVRELQILLNQVGFDLVVDGLDGPATKSAIKTFQGRAGLEKDGLAGPLTMAALKKAIADKNNKPTPPKKEMDEMTIYMDEKLPVTQAKDAERLFQHAYDVGYFDTNHGPKAKTMTRRQFYDLKTSYDIREKIDFKVEK